MKTTRWIRTRPSRFLGAMENCSLIFFVAVSGLLVSASWSKAAELTSCLKLTPEIKWSYDDEEKNSYSFEGFDSDASTPHYYRKNNYTVHYIFDDTFDDPLADDVATGGTQDWAEALHWNEDTAWEYDFDTSTYTKTGGTQTGTFQLWRDSYQIQNRSLVRGDDYTLDHGGPVVTFDYPGSDVGYPEQGVSGYTGPQGGGLDETISDSANRTLSGSGGTNNTYCDQTWEFTETDVLSDPFTTDDLIATVKEILDEDLNGQSEWFPYDGTWLSYRHLYEPEDEVALGKGVYRMKFKGENNVEYELKWTERFVSDDGVIVDKIVTEKVVGTGQFQYTRVHYMDPPAANGSVYLIPPKFTGCECAAGADKSKNGCVDFSITLGQARDGGSAGSLSLFELLPTNSLSTPEALQYDVSTGVSITSLGTTQLVVAPEVVAAIYVLSDYAYQIQLYHVSDFTDLGVGPNGAAFATWQIANPDTSGATTNQLNIIKTSDGLIVTNAYVWSDSDQDWTLKTGNGLRKETKALTIDSGTGDEIETVTIKNQDDAAVYVESRRFHTYPDPLGRALLSVTVDPDGAAKTTSYQYFTNSVADGTNYGNIKLRIGDTGAWTRYQYSSLGQLTNEVSGFTNADTSAADSLCRVRAYSYASIDGSDDGSLDPTSPRTTIETLLGHEISRSYLIVSPGVHKEIQCVRPGAGVNDADNLVTVTTSYTGGDDRIIGKTQVVDASDGTREVNFYSFSDYAGDGSFYVTNTVLRGAPDTGNATNVLDGTRTIAVTTDTGHPIFTKGYDIVSGIMMSSEVDSDFDAFGRPQRLTHLDGTHTDTSYGCCGVDSVTERDGSITTYEYDALKRRFAEHHFVSSTDTITYLTGYDPLGNVLSSSRVGTDASTIVLSSSGFDLAGQLIGATNALQQPTLYTTSIDGSGQMIKTITYNDGGTRVETYFRDGQLNSITGTAMHPVRYEYGVETDGAYYRAYTKEIKLDAGGSDTAEWTKVYADGGNRRYKTVFASASGAPAAVSYFNNKGQLTNQVDPDGVSTLYQYNSKGQLEYTAVDMDGNAEIDFAGTDRIGRTVSDVLTDNGTGVLRIRSFVWAANGSSISNLVSTRETSVDGLRSWNTIWNNGVGVTQSSQIVYDSANARRFVTNTAPDLSYSVTTFQYGRATSLTNRDSLNSQLSAISYGYDAHGRQNTMTDARNGTGTIFYNYADQISGAVTPGPAAGQSAQVITNYFDNMGRIWKTTLADNTSTTNEFYLTGELKRTYGSRTYPVGFSYDAQGRMKTMTNWSSFASGAGPRVTTWSYDGYRGWLTNKTYDSSTAGPAYAYTVGDRLQTRTWARGVTATYNYNTAGDLSTVLYSDGTVGITNGFDRMGRTTSVTNGSTLCLFVYNDPGELLGETYSGGTLNGLTVTNLYDSLLRRGTNGLWNGSGWLAQTHYGYDNASRLLSVSDGTNSATYSYFANSPLIHQIVFTNNGTLRMTTTKSYDNLNRLAQISSSGAGNPISFNYADNSANRRTSVTNADSSYWIYQYDDLGQVTSGKKYWSDSTPVAGQQFTYNFDDIGNRKSAAFGGDQSGANLRSANYTNNSLNQITGRDVPGYINVLGDATNTAIVSVNNQIAYRKTNYFRQELAIANNSGAVWLGVTNLAVLTNTASANIAATNIGNAFIPQNAETFAYDADGNLTNDGRWTYGWDAENRLTNMTSQSTAPSGSKLKLDFVYDYQGRRVQKLVSTWNGLAYVAQSTNRFVYDGWNLIAILNPQSSIVQSFEWGPDLSGSMQGAGGVGGLLAVGYYGAATTNSFVEYDGNGNVAGLVNAADGSTVAQYEYGPFGELIRSTGTVGCPFGFSTKFKDETGLLYYSYRYCNPSTGRWLNHDPIDEFGGLNIYGFSHNDSINNIDPLGLVLAAFDGTGNDAGDDSWQNSKKRAPSNIAIMTELYNGARIYKWGVGTRTDKLTGNLFGNGTGERLDDMMSQLKKYLEDHTDEPVDIIGFSRGAASARIFANLVKKELPCAKIRFLGLFDTVAQMGLPNEFNYQYGYDLDVDTDSIGYTAHAVAADEHRKLFPLTSISSVYQTTLFGTGQKYGPNEMFEIIGPNYWEKPFAGAHSDIGGGYRDFRNLEALRWMIQQGQAAGAPFEDLNEQNYPSYKMLHDMTIPHDSRYPIMDRVPWTHWGRSTRTVFPGNN